MRRLLGSVVLLAGVGLTGIYGIRTNAPEIEAKVLKSAEAKGQLAIHGVTVAVSGRDVELGGVVDSVEEEELLRTEFAQVTGLREMRTDWTVLPKVSPFTFGARWQNGSLSVDGYVPSEAARDTLAVAQDAPVDTLTMASGAPENWSGAAEAGLGAIKLLEEGVLNLSDSILAISGIVRTPVEEAALKQLLEAVPEGFTVETDMTLLDDGTPPAYDVEYNANTGLAINGKLPAGMSRRDVAEVLGFDVFSGTGATGLVGDASGQLARIAVLRDWLPELEDVALTRTEDGISLSGTVAPGVDAELVSAGIAAMLGGEVSLTSAAVNVPDGTQRTNAASGETEVAQAGYWLPRVDFAPSVQTCDAEVTRALEGEGVQFVSGAARLDAKAARAVNRIAAVVAHCVAEGDLNAIIGGHTDSVGNAAANTSLSQERAGAVRAALVARGVAAQALQAAGYGDTRPVATNDTEEGRAANRRTTVEWVDPADIEATTDDEATTAKETE